MLNLKHTLAVENASIISLVETWLDNKVLDAELEVDGYRLYRKDRGARGGGIVTFIRDDLTSNRRTDLEAKDEIIVNEIKANNHESFLLITFYRPPNASTDFSINFRKVLRNAKKTGLKMCILGDLNAPDINWLTMSGKSMHTNELCEDFTDCNLVQINNLPSRNNNSNILDVLLTNISDQCTAPAYCNSLIQSDHFMFQFNINLKPNQRKHDVRWLYNYKNANYDEINYRIEQADIMSKIHKPDQNVNSAWRIWSHQVHAIIDTYIPKKKIKHKTNPWIDGEVLHKIHLKKEAWNKARKTNTENDWQNYKKANNECKKLITRKHSEFINAALEEYQDNPKKFWKVVNIKNKKSSSFPDRMQLDDVTADTPTEKANTFNCFFFSSFNANSYDLPEIIQFQNDNLSYIQLSDMEVFNVLSQLDTRKATGPDNIPAVFLKNCAHTLYKSLTYLFNLSLKTGGIPKAWKTANVVPIYKKGCKNQISNYRPVSLLSVVSKCLERCIHNKIYPIIDQLIHPNQHGFRKGHSTTTQILGFYDKVYQLVDRGTQCDVIYLDLAKAFDSVPHTLLIHKLKGYGFGNNLLSWFTDYLSNREQRVVCEGSTSASKPVLSGVPQGSILGPLLFLLCINDITECCHAQIYLYADDTKLMAPIIERG